MAMRWDPIITAALARELDDTLHRARVRALLLDPGGRRVTLYLRKSTLVLEMHPTAGWLNLLEPTEPLSDSRPLASRIVSVRSLTDESALVFSLQRVRGRDEGVEVIAEFVGNRWNAVVVGFRSRVIRHVLVPREERSRTLRAGSTYQPPPSTGREGREGPVPEARWNEILQAAGPEPRDRRKALLSQVAFTSSLNVERFLDPGGWQAWVEARNPERWKAYLVASSRGPQPYPVPLPPLEDTPTPTLMDAMGRARATESELQDQALLLPPGLLERARKRMKQQEGKARGMTRQLEKAADPAPLRALGDLILARYGEIPRGTDHVRLQDFQGQEVEVELDPTLEPHENADAYYAEAARMERAQAELPGRIDRAQKEAREWAALVAKLETGPEPETIRIVQERLGPERKKGRTVQEKTSLPYRRFLSSGGLEIRVGRGSKRNDELTFHHSSPDDIWLHARQAPGAHVILRWQGRDNPPQRDLTEAATLAALNSEARHSGSVPVDWTRRKYVRKPRKAAPGAVLPEQVQTLFVEPDPKVAKELTPEDRDPD
jgi:predicted ribosome quality control (RQC) complex YloA/Tae2 family protein